MRRPHTRSRIAWSRSPRRPVELAHLPVRRLLDAEAAGSIAAEEELRLLLAEVHAVLLSLGGEVFPPVDPALQPEPVQRRRPAVAATVLRVRAPEDAIRANAIACLAQLPHEGALVLID